MFGLFDAHLKQNVPHQVVPVSARDGPSPPFAVASADFRPLTGAGSRIKGNQSPTYVMCQSLMTAYVMSYPPWRAFGGSDLVCGRVRNPGKLGFNALAGVRGFGQNRIFQMMLEFMRFQCPGGRSGVRTHSPHSCAASASMVSMPWRAFGGSDHAQQQRPEGRGAERFNALAGVRGFGHTALASAVIHERPFQCPGGRSGVRTDASASDAKPYSRVSMPWRAFGGSDQRLRPPWPMPSMRFNALAGVRGFGPIARQRQRPGAGQWVSMPWRAFGGSDPNTHGCMDYAILEFQCPGGRSGVRTEQGQRHQSPPFVSMPWRAFGGSDRLPRVEPLQPPLIVSMPWRAFGGSDRIRSMRSARTLGSSFNALAGVRGFGHTEAELS